MDGNVFGSHMRFSRAKSWKRMAAHSLPISDVADGGTKLVKTGLSPYGSLCLAGGRAC
jgi:hypothetical protein